MIKRISSTLKNLISNINLIGKVYQNNLNDAKSSKVNLGQIQSSLNSQKNSISKLCEVEFQIFSQFGDDGIIQYLINKIEIQNKIFIEFGVENYKESNTRFLLINNKWSGLVIDGDTKNIDFIKSDVIYSNFDLHVECSFITKDNINNIIANFLKRGYPSEIGLLSIDIDGNDYWIWKEINNINPVIVIIEYNSLFGPEKPWTIPYQDDFYRLKIDPLFQYWGVSIAALCHLGEDKGYDFIGCNSQGNNAYFIRKDKRGIFRKLSAAEGYNKALFREYLPDGFKILSFEERLNLIRGKPIFNVIDNSVEYI